MNLKRKGLLKYLIIGCMAFTFMFAITNTKKVYAYDPQSQLTMSLSRYEAYVTINETTQIEFYVSKSPVAIRWGLDDKNIVDAYYRNKTQHVTITGRKIGTTKLKIRAIYSQSNTGYAQVECKIHVIPISAVNVNVSVSQSEFRFNGSSIKPTVYVYNNRNGCQVPSYYYDVHYPGDTVSAGWKTITIVFKGNYTGRRTVEYHISGIEAKFVNIKLSQTNYTYDGSVHRPKVTLSWNGINLNSACYTISWSGDGKSAGIHKVTAYLKDNFEGYVWHTYTISKANIANASIKVLGSSSLPFTGEAQHPEFRVFYRSKQLGYGDFEWSFPRGNIAAEQKILRIHGTGNFYGTKDLYYTITRKNIWSAGICVKNVHNVEYTGQRNPPTPFQVYINFGRTRLYYEQDFTYSLPDGGIKVGKQRLRIIGIGNYCGSYDVYYTILKKNISKSSVKINFLNGNKVTYTGKKNPPTPFEVYINGRRLYYEDDFTYSLPDGGIKVGRQRLRINGVGNYYGSYTTYYTIKKTKGVKELLAKAAEIQKYMYNNHYEYCLTNGKGCEHYNKNRGLTSNSHGLTVDYKDSQTKGKTGYHNTCCGTFVSWTLIESGVMERWELLQGSDGPHCASVSNFNYTGRFNEIYHPSASNIKAGDILIYGSDHHHVEIAAKDGATNGYATVYNAGSYSAINDHNGGTMRAASSASNIDVILRLK